MDGRVCVVTGANSGIGRATALGLARMGASVAMVCRSERAGLAAKEQIQAESGDHDVALFLADLSLQRDVRRLADDLRTRFSRLHVLVNNAGVAPIKRSVTTDGVETTLAVNYLAPFLLTNLLLETLKASAPSRVVNVAGEYHRKATIDFDDLIFQREYSGVRASNRSKLALILFTYELARRLEGTGVTANCLHPGAVATGAPLKDPDLSSLSRLAYRLVKPFFLSPARGAETSIYLASAPEVEGVTGKYFVKKAAVESSPESHDQAVARRLWDVSAGLAGLGAPRTTV
jgi:NAD(P)-dependent dehydrogenase (short-subunit alcohol dehydrogenase family)